MLLEFLKHPKHTGSLYSSSQALSQAMINNIDLQNAHYIAEIGPGLGAFTQKILNLKPKESRYFAIEINPHFVKKLQEKFPNIEIEHKNANRILSIMRSKDIQHLDAVISGIPWSLLKSKEQDLLLKNIHQALKKGGSFSTFAYVLPTPKTLSFKKKLHKYFSQVKTSPIIWNNLPPAFVYYCKK
ncbi:class I SAM-dependent methyltransferase [Helicobacter canadensis]|uniref:Ribosomal RNA adenine dimethylase n=1 Tax=Helicobacter canadensis MIT 98-5491 TaxID=537970 RepID=C5ZXH5_9HELI|nr:rRNA adenine N-6-methyltransferase family protein [Helicobacter canadensis]EES89843.1 ribosomal RNA adenine dimethylase [Helicobacter canadensis MIT 98-5491]EFR48643.1 methyltransferase domain protein [Helicobacter canadensis MIT 98-5491]STO99885.1 16S ribosomal RNA methyltransferase KsgA/Dim1 family protein [Helicobacter canadensis]